MYISTILSCMCTVFEVHNVLYSGLIADRVNLRYFLAVGMIGEWKRNHVQDLI